MATSPAPQTTNGAGEAPTEQPLFAKSVRLLNFDQHGKAGLNRVAGFPFAHQTNSVPLNAVELFEAVRSYPIVFTPGEQPIPVAILGLEQKNIFLDAQHQWKAGHYVPGYIRQYPFFLLKNPGDGQMMLCVDEAAESFSKETPDMPFYTAQDKPSDFSQKALEYCVSYYHHYLNTLDFANALKANDLLTARQTNVTLPNGNKLNLGGYLTVDEEKYLALSDELFLDWRKKGWSMLIDCILISTVNWKYLANFTADA